MIAEEVCEAGCVGSILSTLAAEAGIPVKAKLLNLGSGIVPHGGRAQLMLDYGIDAGSIAHAAECLCRETENE